ncbi:MAG TPA: carboxypeptidase regulatory-like domain-containing protein, partial [Thermoanaerobaculaceae bacterium]|nr:carboxypeptidase regulatory-like domain-containing protein [Thermoanaerobaculaceae bacterium]
MTGIIADAQNNSAGIGSATVKVNGVAPPISTATAGDGTFTLSGVPAGPQTINASAVGYVAADSGTLPVPAGGNVNAGALALSRTTVTISGTVTDSVTGTPLAGASVTVPEQSGAGTGTDESGHYSIPDVFWGSIHLVVSLDRYTTKTVPLTLTPGTNATRNITLDSAYGTITGEVDDVTTGIGLPAVTVSLTDDPSIATGVDGYGHYSLENVPVGSHSLTAARDLYTSAITSPVAVGPGTTTAPAIAMSPLPCSVSGVVRDGTTGDFIAGAVVTAAREGQSATTDNWGAYTLGNLPPGAELLAVTAAGYAPIATDVILLNPGDTVSDWELDLFPPGNAASGTVHGIVRDSSGSPLADVTVGLVGGPDATTGPDGTYSITAPGGRYALVAAKPGYRTIFTPNAGDGPTTSIWPWQIRQDLVLPAADDAASLEITMHDPVLLTPRDGSLPLWTPPAAYWIKVPSSGERTVPGVPAGPLYGLPYLATLAGGAVVPLDVTGPQTMPETSPSWAVAGRVVRDTTKAPIQGATVTLTNPSASFMTTVVTDANGRWSFSDGPLGDYSVAYSAPDGLDLPYPWTFTASDGYYEFRDAALVGSADDGTVSCTSPASGATLTSQLSYLDCSATLPRAGDFIVTAFMSLSRGQVFSQTPTFDLDGTTFHVDLSSVSQDGAEDIYVSALTRWGAWVDTTIPVVMTVSPVVTSLTLNPEVVLGGSSSLATITLAGPGLPGGSPVMVSSSEPEATVPDTVTVPEGQTTATFTVATSMVAAATQATITAATGGTAQSATLTIQPVGVSSVSLDPSSVRGGTQSTGTVTLNGAAPSGDLAVTLSSSNTAVATVPATVTVTSGSTSAQFPVTTASVTSTTAVTISASGGGTTQTATLTVQPIAVVSVSLNPASLLGGTQSTGTVTLNGAAPSGDLAVTLSSSNTAVATVPATVTVTSGSTSAQFPVTTVSVTSTTAVTISALGGGAVQSAILTVSPLAIASVYVSPNPVVGPYAYFWVSLSFPAPTGGTVVGLSSANPAVASVPATLTVQAGSTTGWALVSTTPVDAPTQVVLSASLGGQPSTVTLEVDPVVLSGITVTTPVTGGMTTTGILTANSYAPTGGLVVTLTSSNPAAAAVPSPVTIPPGSQTVSFQITTTYVASPTQVQIQGTAHGQSQSATLTVNPVGPSTVLCGEVGFYTQTLVGGISSPCTLFLTGTAPPGGIVVDLTSDNPILPVPASVTVAAGYTGALFTASPATVASTVAVNIGMTTASGMSAQTTLTVQPPGPAGMTFNPSPVAGGSSTTGTVQLNAPAPVGGLTVALSSNDPVATVPPSITVPAAAPSATFTVTTTASTTKTVTITASANGLVVSRTLSVVVGATLNRVSLAPSSAAGQGTVAGTVWIDGISPPGGLVVSLTSDTPSAATVPASVTIPVNATSAPFSVSTVCVASPTNVVISAVLAGTTKSATLALSPLALASLEVELGSQGLAGGWTLPDNTVSLNGPAPAGGVSVGLSSSSFDVDVPTTVLIAASDSSAVFDLTTSSVCANTTATITATLGTVTKTGTFLVVPTEPKSISGAPATVAGGDQVPVTVALTGDPTATACQIALASSDTALATLPSVPQNCVSVGGTWSTAEYRCPATIAIPETATSGQVTITATGPTRTATATLDVQAGTIVTGVAPGAALPGDTLAVYGTAFAPQASVVLSGPVYTLTDTTTPLCTLETGQCPSDEVPGVVNSDATALSFVLPEGMPPGIYSLQVHDDPRHPSAGTWFAVAEQTTTRPVVPADQHQAATLILPGQTVTGTLTGDHPVGDVSDYNFFYFVGTAGSTINVTLERVDTSQPWEHPDSLDPQVEVVAPDGFVYQNLVSFDNQPSVDLNASLHDAVLPLSGLYFISVETTRGHGDYRLSFSFGSHAPAAAADRVVPVSGNDQNVPVGSLLDTATLMLDPQGLPISGAQVTYAITPAPEDHGSINLSPLVDPPIRKTTTVYGFAMKTVAVLAGGKVQFGP